MATFFTDAFGINPNDLEAYGAFDISTINDLPLFIDPFLLFHSENPKYHELHENIIIYLIFLRERAANRAPSTGEIKNWYCFPEVKQDWLGFSLVGNGGTGLGVDFGQQLHANLHAIFSDFGEERVTEGSHIEKVCLIADGVGKDNISDFVTNLILDFLCGYTETFAAQHLKDSQTRRVSVTRAKFNYTTEMWERKHYRLPWFNGDYIILTPKDILARDDNWINRNDLLDRFEEIPVAITDASLRAAVSNYFYRTLETFSHPDKAPSKSERHSAAADTIRQFPKLIDYYIKLKEINGDSAVNLSAERVLLTELQFSTRLREILQPLLAKTDFYTIAGGTYAEAHARVGFLKHVIEDMGGWRIFYDDNGRAFERERDLQILFRLVWWGTPSDVGTEANDGRGPVDFKVSKGRHKTLVEMKLASSSKLESNLSKQLEIYQTSADAERGIKVVIYFEDIQHERVERILKRLGLNDSDDVVLIDARKDNKPSASKAR